MGNGYVTGMIVGKEIKSQLNYKETQAGAELCQAQKYLVGYEINFNTINFDKIHFDEIDFNFDEIIFV